MEMLFRCNIIALVGGGKNPRYPPNKVMLWDDHLSRCVGELCFRTEVKAVKLRRDRIAVALEHKIYVYNFDDLHLLDTVETCHNPRGLCCMSALPTSPVLACPDRLRGHVRLQLYCYERTVLISAHESSVACLALNKDGNLLATASDKGTLVRIFQTSEGQLLQEVRRGIDRAEIYCLAFDSLSKWIACSSDKGTIHIFAVKSEQIESRNPTSSFSFMKRILPKYFDSEWSFSQFRVPDVRTVCAFGPTPGTLVVVSQNGIYYLATFDPEISGDCTQHVVKQLKEEEVRS